MNLSFSSKGFSGRQCECDLSLRQTANQDCEAKSNNCNGNGKCKCGKCECTEGYVGDDCSVEAVGDYDGSLWKYLNSSQITVRGFE